MRSFRDLSIRHKLTLLLVGVATIVLLAASTAMVISEYVNTRERLKLRYGTLTNVFAGTGATTLDLAQGEMSLVDPTVLSNLKADQDVVFGALYNVKNERVAVYIETITPDPNKSEQTAPEPNKAEQDSADSKQPPERLAAEQMKSPGARFTDNGFLDVVQEVTKSEEDGTKTSLGWLYLRASTQQLNTQVWRSLRITGAVLFFAIVLTVLLSFVSQRVVSASILSLANATERVSSQHDYSVRVQKHGDDELGLLCDRFNAMLSEIQGKENQLAESNTELGKSVTEMRSALGQLRERESQLERANEELDRTIQGIRAAVNQLSTMSDELMATIAQQTSGAQQQAAAVAEMVSTVTEVSETAEQAADTAKNVGDAARRTVDVGQAGRRAVADCLAAMETVNEHVNNTAQSTLSLAERAQVIGEIIETVKTFAEQTNLLALNAAIEASRAGEHGKGFAVVAADVKDLAEQSKKATQQIRQILGEIQQATNATVLSTDEGAKAVKMARAVVAQADQTIDTLAKTLEESSRAAAQIVASARQQAQGMQQVDSAVKNIDGTTQQSIVAARQVKETAQNLIALSSELSELISEHGAGVRG